jgi:hypothetical protein
MSTRALVATVAVALAAIALLACPPQNLPQPVPPPEVAPGYDPPPPDDTPATPIVRADAAPSAPPTGTAGDPGAACTTDADCGSGVCEGLGCGTGQGRCAAADRSCTFDIQRYCGCDGVTFEASGSCPGKRYAHRGMCTNGGQSSSNLADGASCLDSAECASGICEGTGCGPAAPGKCIAKKRKCTRDARPYCGCDGVTFTASGSCPGRRYAAKGACPE